jgi:predicted short-subunit dehydrogenase-like oxidoreductase (DUF2520 family)
VKRMTGAGWVCRLVRCRDGPAAARCRVALSGLPIDHWKQPLPWPDVSLVMITVPDRTIPEVASSLANTSVLDGTVVLHSSGLEDSQLLETCRTAGARVGSWHPLQCFPASPYEVSWDGIACAVEGDLEALAVGESLAHQLGMRPWRIAAQDKPVYHAAASVAANLPHVLIAFARRLINRGGGRGAPPSDALDLLVRTSVDVALVSRGLEGLTGPLARGDEDTVRRHLEALPPEVGAVYRAVAELVSSHLADTVFD